MKNFEFRTSTVSTHVFNKVDDPTVLDIASSDGRKSAQLYFKNGQNPERWTALDVNQTSLDILQGFGCTTYQIELGTQKIDSVVNGVFDVVLCTELLEHFKTTKEQLSILNEAIDRTGKFLVISFPRKPVLDNYKYGHKCKRMDVDNIKSRMSEEFKIVNTYDNPSGQIILIGER